MKNQLLGLLTGLSMLCLSNCWSPPERGWSYLTYVQQLRTTVATTRAQFPVRNEEKTDLVTSTTVIQARIRILLPPLIFLVHVKRRSIGFVCLADADQIKSALILWSADSHWIKKSSLKIPIGGNIYPLSRWGNLILFFILFVSMSADSRVPQSLWGIVHRTRMSHCRRQGGGRNGW